MTQVFGNKLAPVAAGYAELGLSVFPVQDGLICVENPKDWKEQSSNNPAEVRDLFDLYPEANGIALDCGKSGIVGIVLQEKEGKALFDQVNASHNIKTDTWSYRTSGGGLTLLYRADKENPIKTSLRHNIYTNIMGTGSYCLLPSSSEGEPWIKELDPKNTRLVPVDDSIRALISDLEGLRPSWLPDRDPALSDTGLVCAADIEEKEVPWLWPGYIARGMLFGVQGDPGSGKSYVTTKIAADITNGKLPPDINGDIPTIEPGNVLICNPEDSNVYTIKKRLNRLGAKSERVFLLGDESEPLVFSDLERIENMIKACKPVYVIFDPIQTFLGRDVDMYRPNDVRPIMNGISALAAKYNFACGIVGHMNKGGGAKALYRYLGTVDFAANFRTMFLVGTDQRESSPESKLFIQIKNNIAQFQPGLRFTILKNETLRWDGVDKDARETHVLVEAKAKDETALQEAIEWIRTLVDDQPVWSTDLEELAKEQGISTATLKRAKRELSKSREIETRRAPGLYRWYVAKPGTDINYSDQLAYQVDQACYT